MYVSSIFLAGIDKLICDEGKSFLGLMVTRGHFSVPAGGGVSLVPKQVLPRCCTGPMISCTATCWQMSVRSSLRHDPSWDVPQRLIQLFSCVSTSVHPPPIQSRSLQRIVLVEPYAACLGSKAKQNEPALEGFITKNKAHPPYLFKAFHGLSSRFSLS